MGNSNDAPLMNADDEAVIHDSFIIPDEDGRQPIYATQHADDVFIQCIGRLRSNFGDEKLTRTEHSGGSGTVIQIDSQNRCYILTVAHNICKLLRKCSNCSRKTIHPVCTDCNNIKTYVIKPITTIEPDEVIFHRTYTTTDNFGRDHTTHSIRKPSYYYRKELYTACCDGRGSTSVYSGYDIALLTFQLNKTDNDEEINIYREICPRIKLVSDDKFGGSENVLHIYGFPADKCDNGKYGMYGMSSQRSHNGNSFSIEINCKTNKQYIVNKEIDTSSGQSGSCIWAKNDNEYIIYGVHTSGKSGRRSGIQQNVIYGTNFGTFLDNDNCKWIKSVKDQLSLHTFLEQQTEEEEKKEEKNESYSEKLERIIEQHTADMNALLSMTPNGSRKDKFDVNSVKNKSIEVYDDIAMSIGGWDTILLSNMVSEGIHSWRFKIIQCQEIYFGVYFGQQKKLPKYYLDGFIGEKANEAYVFDAISYRYNNIGKDNQWTKVYGNGNGVDKNMIVEMCIDFNNRSLSFTIDGQPCTGPEDFGGFQQIVNGNYRAAISLKMAGDKIQII